MGGPSLNIRQETHSPGLGTGGTVGSRQLNLEPQRPSKRRPVFGTENASPATPTSTQRSDQELAMSAGETFTRYGFHLPLTYV